MYDEKKNKMETEREGGSEHRISIPVLRKFLAYFSF